MLPCEDVRKLAEEYVSDTLDAPRHAEVARHLRVCSSCHRAVEEARLTHRVLRDAGAPPPPPRMADRIKMAAFTRLSRRPRPLHERALGSPAFLATCASLVCGAIICLLAILKVAYVQPWPPPSPPQVTVVETYHLPARTVAHLLPAAATPVAQRPAPRRVESLALVHRPAAARLRVVSAAAPAPAPRPTRGYTALTSPSPTMSVSPHLPTPSVALAGVRISRPDGLTEAVRVEPVALDGGDGEEMRELSAPLGTATARGDFTSTR